MTLTVDAASRNTRDDTLDFDVRFNVNVPAVIQKSLTYAVGSIQHHSESTEIAKNLGFQLHALCALVQEYVEEIADVTLLSERQRRRGDIAASITTCACCLKAPSILDTPLLRCSECEITMYCSDDCLQRHRGVHKKSCREAARRKGCKCCGKKEDVVDLQLCARCKRVRCCNSECQIRDWLTHKPCRAEYQRLTIAEASRGRSANY
jgi:hypothetical protein